jgi:8-oxo-dGTP diphosphatase
LEKEVEKIYGHRVRVRVCGICIVENKILLIHHRYIGKKGSLWAPPGGGLDFGETATQTLIREYKEETGLDIIVKEFLFVNEYFSFPFHSMELFFRVEITGGFMAKGTDPEMSNADQIIEELRYWSYEEIAVEEPLLFHSVIRNSKNISDLLTLRGYLETT